jgi:hypothetical protein
MFSKIQRTFFPPRKWLTHLADRIHNTKKYYYSALRYKIKYGLCTSHLNTTESFRFQHLPTGAAATQPH